MISSTAALALIEVPSKLIVVGAGYIGLELGTAFAKIGAAVTVVEAQGRNRQAAAVGIAPDRRATPRS